MIPRIFTRGYTSSATSAVSVTTGSPLGVLQKKGPGGRASVTGLTATVFGCTGFLGRYVVNRLVRSGTQVVLPYRGEEYDYKHLRLMGDLGQVIPQRFHLKDETSIKNAVKHSDIVINLIGKSNETRNFKYDDVHVAGAAAIAEAARESNVSRFVHVSCLGAQLHSRSRFLGSKWRGEKAVRQAFPSATVLRPSTLFGPEDQFFNRMAWLQMFPLGIPVMNYGEQIVQPVYAIDVAAAIGKLIFDDSTIGKTYELTGPKEYTYSELVEYFSKIIHKSVGTINVPRSLFELMGTLMDLAPQTKLCREDVIRMQMNERRTLGLPGLPELGITPTKVESVAIQFLRAFRSGSYYDEPISDEDYYFNEEESAGIEKKA